MFKQTSVWVSSIKSANSFDVNLWATNKSIFEVEISLMLRPMVENLTSNLCMTMLFHHGFMSVTEDLTNKSPTEQITQEAFLEAANNFYSWLI